VYFVDYANGNDSNGGLSPGKAKKNLGILLSALATGDVVYVRPHTTAPAHHGDTQYLDNQNGVIPATAVGVSIIGTGQGRYMAKRDISLRGASGDTTSVISTSAAHTNIENLGFHARDEAVDAGIIRGNSLTSVGLNVSNCAFLGTGAFKPGIKVESSNYSTIENCIFAQCKEGISLGSSDMAQYFDVIRGCIFLGLAATRNEDIQMGDVYELVIDSCVFTGDIPSGGAQNQYIYSNGAASTGSVINSYFGTANRAFDECTTGLGSFAWAHNYCMDDAAHMNASTA